MSQPYELHQRQQQELAIRANKSSLTKFSRRIIIETVSCMNFIFNSHPHVSLCCPENIYTFNTPGHPLTQIEWGVKSRIGVRFLKKINTKTKERQNDRSFERESPILIIFFLLPEKWQQYKCI